MLIPLIIERGSKFMKKMRKTLDIVIYTTIGLQIIFAFAGVENWLHLVTVFPTPKSEILGCLEGRRRCGEIPHKRNCCKGSTKRFSEKVSRRNFGGAFRTYQSCRLAVGFGTEVRPPVLKGFFPVLP
jgi:hypothetical protein